MRKQLQSKLHASLTSHEKIHVVWSDIDMQKGANLTTSVMENVATVFSSNDFNMFTHRNHRFRRGITDQLPILMTKKIFICHSRRTNLSPAVSRRLGQVGILSSNDVILSHTQESQNSQWYDRINYQFERKNEYNMPQSKNKPRTCRIDKIRSVIGHSTNEQTISTQRNYTNHLVFRRITGK